MSQKKHIDAIKSATQHQHVPGIEQDNVKSKSPSESSTASPTHSAATGKPKMSLQHPPAEQLSNIQKQQPSHVYSKPLSQIAPQHHLPIPLSLQPNRSGSIERNTNLLHPSSNDQHTTLHPTQQNDLNQELNVPEVVEHELQAHVSIEPKHKHDQIKLHSSTFNTTMVVPQGLVNIHAANTNPIKPGGGLDPRVLQPVKSIPQQQEQQQKQQQKQQSNGNNKNNNNNGKKVIIKKPSMKKLNNLKDVGGVIQNSQQSQQSQQSNTSPPKSQQQDKNSDNENEPTMDLSDFVQESPLPPRNLNQSTYQSISSTYNKDKQNQYQEQQQQQQQPPAAISNSTSSQHSNFDDVIIPAEFQEHSSFQHDDEKNSEIEMGKFVQHKQHKGDDIDHKGRYSITPMPADDKVPIHNESQSNAQIIHQQPSSHQIVTNNNNNNNNNDQVTKPIDNNQIPSLARRKSISKLDQRGGPLIHPTPSNEQNNIDQPSSKPSKHEVDIGEVFDHQYKLESVQAKQNDSIPTQRERFLIEPRESHTDQLDDEKDSKSQQLNQNVKSPRKYTKNLPMQQTGNINLNTIPNSTSPSLNHNNNNLSTLPSLPEPISSLTPTKFHSPHQLSSSNNSVQSSNRSDFVVLDTYDKDQSKSGASSSKLSAITNESEISNYPLSNQHLNSQQNNYPMNIASTPTTNSIASLDCHLPISTRPQKLSPQHNSASLYDGSIDNSAIDTGSVQTVPHCNNCYINPHQVQTTGHITRNPTQLTNQSHNNNNNNNNFRLPPSNNNYIPNINNNTTTTTTTNNNNNNNNNNPSISIHKKRRHSNDDGQPNIPASTDTWSIPTPNNDPFSKPTTSTCSIQGSTIDEIEDSGTPNVDQQLYYQNDSNIQPTNRNELNQSESTSSSTTSSSSSSGEHSQKNPIEDNTEHTPQISHSFNEEQFSPNQSHNKMIPRHVISTDQQYDDNCTVPHTTFITNNIPSRTTSILSIDIPISPHPTPLVDEQAPTNQAQCGSLGDISESGYDTNSSSNQQQFEEQQYNPNFAHSRSQSCNPLQQQQFYDQQQQYHDQKLQHHHPHSSSSTSLNIDNYNQYTLPTVDQITPIPTLFQNESTPSNPNSHSSQPLSRPLSTKITPPAPIPADSIQKLEDNDGIDSTFSQLPQRQSLLESNFPQNNQHNHQPNNQPYNHSTRYVDNIIMKNDKMNQHQQSSQKSSQSQQLSSQQRQNSIHDLQLDTDSRNLSKSKYHQVEFTANDYLPTFTTHSKTTPQHSQPNQDHKQQPQHHISPFSPSPQGDLADIDESNGSTEQVEIQKDAINKKKNNNNHHDPIGRNNAINPTRNPLSDTNMTDVEHIYKQQQQQQEQQQNQINENHRNVNMNNNLSSSQPSNNQEHSAVIDFQCNSQADLQHHDHELQHEIFSTKQYVIFSCNTPMGGDDDGDIEDNTSTLTSPRKSNQSTQLLAQPQSQDHQLQQHQLQQHQLQQHQLQQHHLQQPIEEDEYKSSKFEQHYSSIPQQHFIAKDKQKHYTNSDNNIKKHENNIDSQ